VAEPQQLWWNDSEFWPIVATDEHDVPTTYRHRLPGIGWLYQITFNNGAVAVTFVPDPDHLLENDWP
jgi:hypothetical protein